MDSDNQDLEILEKKLTDPQEDDQNEDINNDQNIEKEDDNQNLVQDSLLVENGQIQNNLKRKKTPIKGKKKLDSIKEQQSMEKDTQNSLEVKKKDKEEQLKQLEKFQNQIQKQKKQKQDIRNFFQQKQKNIQNKKNNLVFGKQEQLSLKNKLQNELSKLSQVSTRETAMKSIKEIITENNSKQHLRIYINVLCEGKRAENTGAQECELLLLAFLSSVYKKNLIDPQEKPESFETTLLKLIETIHKYLSEPQKGVQQASARALREVYKNCMFDMYFESVILLMFEPLLRNLMGGSGRVQCQGSCVCLGELVYVIRQGEGQGKDLLAKIQGKVLQGFFKLNPEFYEILSVINSMLDVFGAKFVQNSKVKQFTYKLVNFLDKAQNQQQSTILSKVESCQLLGRVTETFKWEGVLEDIDYSVVIDSLQKAAKERNLAISKASTSALQKWQALIFKDEPQLNKYQDIMKNHNQNQNQNLQQKNGQKIGFQNFKQLREKFKQQKTAGVLKENVNKSDKKNQDFFEQHQKEKQRKQDKSADKFEENRSEKIMEEDIFELVKGKGFAANARGQQYTKCRTGSGGGVAQNGLPQAQVDKIRQKSHEKKLKNLKQMIYNGIKKSSLKKEDKDALPPIQNNNNKIKLKQKQKQDESDDFMEFEEEAVGKGDRNAAPGRPQSAKKNKFQSTDILNKQLEEMEDQNSKKQHLNSLNQKLKEQKEENQNQQRKSQEEEFQEELDKIKRAFKEQQENQQKDQLIKENQLNSDQQKYLEERFKQQQDEFHKITQQQNLQIEKLLLQNQQLKDKSSSDIEKQSESIIRPPQQLMPESVDPNLDIQDKFNSIKITTNPGSQEFPDFNNKQNNNQNDANIDEEIVETDSSDISKISRIKNEKQVQDMVQSQIQDNLRASFATVKSMQMESNNTFLMNKKNEQNPEINQKQMEEKMRKMIQQQVQDLFGDKLKQQQQVEKSSQNSQISQKNSKNKKDEDGDDKFKLAIQQQIEKYFNEKFENEFKTFKNNFVEEQLKQQSTQQHLSVQEIQKQIVPSQEPKQQKQQLFQQKQQSGRQKWDTKPVKIESLQGSDDFTFCMSQKSQQQSIQSQNQPQQQFFDASDRVQKNIFQNNFMQGTQQQQQGFSQTGLKKSVKFNVEESSLQNTQFFEDTQDFNNNSSYPQQQSQIQKEQQLQSTWQQALYMLQHQQFDSAYEIILNGEDDMQLMRLFSKTGPCYEVLSSKNQKRTLERINRLYQNNIMQHIGLNLFEGCLENNLIEDMDIRQNQEMLQMLYDMSSSANSYIGSRSAQLFCKVEGQINAYQFNRNLGYYYK